MNLIYFHFHSIDLCPAIYLYFVFLTLLNALFIIYFVKSLAQSSLIISSHNNMLSCFDYNC